MRDTKADIIATSPPYTDQRDYTEGAFDWQQLMCAVFDCAVAHAQHDAHLLFNLGLSHKDRRVDMYWSGWLTHCEAQGWPLFGWYVWDKGSGMPGNWNGRLAPAHEFVFHFNQETESANKWVETLGRTDLGKKFRQKDGSVKEVYSADKVGQPFKVPDSVIRIGREMARGIHTQNHPAVFSPEFAGFFLLTWSQEEAVALEPFAGSGTTIVAAEQNKRACYAMEISPAYVAVCLERLSALGLTPKLAE
jgi:DNA modification methylase